MVRKETGVELRLAYLSVDEKMIAGTLKCVAQAGVGAHVARRQNDIVSTPLIQSLHMAAHPVALSSMASSAAFTQHRTTCVICGARDLTSDFSRSFHDLQLAWSRCRRCGTSFMNPAVAPDVMIAYYNDSAYWQQEYGNYLGGEALRLEQHRRRLARIATQLLRDGLWLDVGCAAGASTLAAHERGFRVLGIDPAAEMVAAGRRRYGLDLRVSSLESFVAAPTSFDVISLWGADSTLPDPRAAFGRIAGLLRTGGRFVLTTQDYGHWIRRLFPSIKQSVNAYVNFAWQSLRLLFAEVGLQIVYDKTDWQVTELGRLTRTTRFGQRLFSRWNERAIIVPAISYRLVIAARLSAAD